MNAIQFQYLLIIEKNISLVIFFNESKETELQNKEEQIDGFYDGERPLGKEECVIWEFAKIFEG